MNSPATDPIATNDPAAEAVEWSVFAMLVADLAAYRSQRANRQTAVEDDQAVAA